MKRIETIKKPVQLPRLYPKHIGLRTRPSEPLPFEPLVKDPESVPIPHEQLDRRLLPIAKGKHIAGKGISVEMLRDKHGEPVDPLAHIRAADRQINICARPEGNHENISRARSRRTSTV